MCCKYEHFVFIVYDDLYIYDACRLVLLSTVDNWSVKIILPPKKQNTEIYVSNFLKESKEWPN